MNKAIQITNRQRALSFPRSLGALMRHSLEEALSRFGLVDNSELYVSMVSPSTIQRLNREYRENNAVTDVLSFPTIDWAGENPGKIPENKHIDIDPKTGRFMLGDIVICLKRATEQANDYGHSLEREVCFLAVHGLLHLLGFDHMNDDDEKRMQELTESILTDLDLNRPNSVVQTN